MRQYHVLDHNWQHTSPASLIKGLSILWYHKDALGVHVRQKCIYMYRLARHLSLAASCTRVDSGLTSGLACITSNMHAVFASSCGRRSVASHSRLSILIAILQIKIRPHHNAATLSIVLIHDVSLLCSRYS